MKSEIIITLYSIESIHCTNVLGKYIFLTKAFTEKQTNKIAKHRQELWQNAFLWCHKVL